MKPRIGITHSLEIEAEPYFAAVAASGGEGVLVEAGAVTSLDDLDGLLLAGGVDVNPALYGETPTAETEAPNDARDQLEVQLLGGALARDVPVLGICRGMQLMNVALGGSLTQHQEGHAVRPENKAEPAHRAMLEPDTRLAGILGEAAVAVNSRHHQTVNRLGKGLVVAARAEDGTVEAIELPHRRFALAVQWHPENMAATSDEQRRIFDAFVRAASNKTVTD